MKKQLILPLFILLFVFKSFSQCNDHLGNWGFEMSALSSGFYAPSGSKGTQELTSEDFYSGSKSLKVDVTTASSWEVRMFGTNADCYYDKSVDQTITVSFYAKGPVGNKITVSLMDASTLDVETTIELTSTDWKRYNVSMKSTTNSTNGNFRLIFLDEGIYYVDEITVNKYDCNNEEDGTASLDACEVCAGGSTGITPSESCTSIHINPNDPKFAFNGVIDTTYNDGKLSLFRFKKTYIENANISPEGDTYREDPARTTSGVIVKFKTASPQITASFARNLDNADDYFWTTFDIYKNGELYKTDKLGTVDNYDVELSNQTAELVEWSIALPALEEWQFLGVDIIEGFPLQSIPTDTRPVYVAIGNSQTQGVGVYDNRTSKGYPFLVADELDYQLHNMGIGGSAISSGVIENLNGTIIPDLISVMWGYNDVHYFGDFQFTTRTFTQYESLMESLASSYPDACIMAILPNYSLTDSIVTPGVRSRPILRQKQTEIIEDLQLTYPNLFLMNGLNYTDAAGVSDADNIHMNEIGNQSLADGIIYELGKSSCGLSVSTAELEKEKLTVYPNPTSGIINLNENLYIQISDVSGKLIFQGKTKSFDLSKFDSGLYIIQSEQGISKIIKK